MFAIQFIRGEYKKPEEYKEFIDNPAEFIHNKVLPRACVNLSKPGSAQYAYTLTKLARKQLTI